MFSVKSLVVLALAGTSMAAPWQGPNWSGGYNWKNGYTSTVAAEEATATEYATVSPVAEATVTATMTYHATATAVTSTTAAPAAATTSSTSTSTGSSLDDYMSIVTKWRTAGGLKALVQDSKLEANALKTVTDSAGSMVHELNSGSMAQVLAPGTDTNFESVYVGGWLCEVPSLAGLNGICATMDAGWDHSDGETGHAEILTSTSYTKIGCALFDKIWACDLA